MSDFTISQIIEALSEPFPSSEVEFKPGALNRDKTRALALAYVDSRTYIQRLNLVAPDWQDEYQVTILPDRVVVICRLTVEGITRTGDGECLLSGGEEGGRVEANAVTTASAQAFKRACVKFSLGAYLYSLPQVWCEYDHARRKIVNPPHLPDWALPSGEKLIAAIERVAQETGLTRATDEANANFNGVAHQFDQAEPANPSETIVHFGKMKNKTLAEVWALGPDGQGWLRWCANTDGKGFDPRNEPTNVHLQRMAKAFIALQSAYAG